MKKNYLKNLKTYLFVLTIIGLLTTSCSDEGTVSDDQLVDLESSALSQTEIDDISEGINDIIENVYFETENDAESKSAELKNDSNSKFLPDCVVITKVITGNSKNVTIDYGEGCTMRNGNVLSGKILMEITFNLSRLNATIKSSFEGFYRNGKKVEGVVVKTRSIVDGVPVAVINSDLKIIWEDESFVTIVGERKRSWVEGFKNFDFTDNVFSITGNWTVTRKDGSTKMVTIIEPLIRKMMCKYIVSGVLKIEKRNREITVDYGDGTCDASAVATSNGNSKEIELGKRRK